MNEFIKAFLLITLAEMGDKTQLLALAFSSKFKATSVLIGIFIGAFLNHGIAIWVGNYVSKFIPMNLIQIVASVLFLLFGLWSLNFGDDDEEEDDVKMRKGPIITVAAAFFIGELGDKTQLTAMTLGADAAYPIIVLLATTSAMVFTGGLGILVGKFLGKKIPEVTMKIIAAIVFLFFGTTGLYYRIPHVYLTPLNIIAYFLILSLAITLILRNNSVKKHIAYEEKLASILLQCKNCGQGHMESCLVNQSRVSLENSYIGENIPYIGNAIKYLESLGTKNMDMGLRVKKIYESKKVLPQKKSIR